MKVYQPAPPGTVAAPAGQWHRAGAYFYPVSSNVSVALITALATLGGVAVTGTITLMATRMQIRDQNGKEKRQLRRDTYVAYLNESTRLERTLMGFWDQVTDSPTSKLNEFETTAKQGTYEALKPVSQQLNVVFLEGPDEVAEAARELHKAQLLEARQIILTARESLKEANRTQSDVIAQTQKARNRFLSTARDALR
jgi:hypothetical protein